MLRIVPLGLSISLTMRQRGKAIYSAFFIWVSSSVLTVLATILMSESDHLDLIGIYKSTVWGKGKSAPFIYQDANLRPTYKYTRNVIYTQRVFGRDRPIIGYTDYLNRYQFRYRIIGIGIPHIGISIIAIDIGNGKIFRACNRLDYEFSRFND